MSLTNDSSASYDWRYQRKTGVIAIVGSTVVFAALWLVIRYYAPILQDMHDLAPRLLLTFKCCCVAVLFCFATGIDAVAHERLQSAAFDPLQGHRTRRLQINQRYLQNTLEQLVMFITALFGLAVYSADGDAMRAVEATTVVWILARLAFWAGYHRSAAMRGIGMAGLALPLLILIYVVARIGFDLAGIAGAIVVLVAFLLFEVLLFRVTRGTSKPA